MTHLTPSRDALAEALADTFWRKNPKGPEEWADAILASGAIIDARTLADDEEVVEKIERDIDALEATEVDPSVEQYAYTALHAVVAALRSKDA